jgi:hypothetical protein
MEDKYKRDEFGELFQDAFTENQTKRDGSVRDDIEHDIHLDPNVDSEEADRAMAENRFGVNKVKPKS